MAREIELPDGSIAEFPDEMGDDEISAVLSKQFGSKPPEPTPEPPAPALEPPPRAELTLAEKLGGMIPQSLQKLAGNQAAALGAGEPSNAFDAAVQAGLGTLKEEGTGALKGLGQLAVGAGEVVRAGARKAGLIGEDVADARRQRNLSQRIRDTQQTLGLEPKGAIQKLGAFAAKSLPAAVTGGGSLPVQMAGSAAQMGGLSALEGGSAGDVALAAGLGALGPAGGKIAKEAAPWLKGKAVEQYTKALHPTGRAAKLETAKIVPELLKRGVRGDLEKLAAQGTELSDVTGAAIEKTYAASSKAGKRIDAARLADELEQLKAPFIGDAKDPAAAFMAAKNNPALADLATQGKMVLNEPAYAAISDIQSQLRLIKPDPESVWKLRKNLDNIVKATGGFERPLPPQAQAAIAKDARAIIQKELTKANPDVAKLNQEYQLWESLQRVATETGIRKTGQQGAAGMLARTGGGAVGALIGAVGSPAMSAGGAMAGQQATKMLTELVSGPAWRTTSAVVKARLADLLASGKTQQAIEYMGKIAAAKAGRPSNLREDVEAKRREYQMGRELR